MSRPWNDFLSENEAIASTVYESSKRLVNVSPLRVIYVHTSHLFLTLSDFVKASL